MKRFISFSAILIILVSSTGTTIAMHYCGKTLHDIAVFEKAKSCSEFEMPSGCCHNEKVEIKSDNFDVTQQIAQAGFDSFLIQEISFPVIDFSLHFQHSTSNSFLSDNENTHPPSGPDIVVLQSFLI